MPVGCQDVDAAFARLHRDRVRADLGIVGCSNDACTHILSALRGGEGCTASDAEELYAIDDNGSGFRRGLQLNVRCCLCALGRAQQQ